jgi:hypothetical protein
MLGMLIMRARTTLAKLICEVHTSSNKQGIQCREACDLSGVLLQN